MSVLGLIAAAVLLLALVVIVVLFSRRGSGAGVDARGVRRFFQYLLLYALAIVVCVGLGELLGRLLGAVPGEFEDATGALARALAFVIVGLPVGGGLALWTWRQHRANPEERDSGIFAAYLTLAALTGLVRAVLLLQDLLVNLSRTEYDADALGQFIVWTALWAVHWVLARRLLDEELGSAHLLIGSLITLALSVQGLVLTLARAVDVLLWPRMIGASGITESGALLLAAGSAWLLYWVFGAARLRRDTWWLAYVLLAGVGGGLVMALAAASQLFWDVLVWLVGDRGEASLMEHFDSAAVQFAALVVGLLVWWYHGSVLGAGREARTEVRRVYEYLVAGIGLAAAAAGVGTLVVTLIEALTPGVDIGMSVTNTLLAGLTALLVGAPVWWLMWMRIRRQVAADPAVEVPSISRRIFLVVLFGISGIVAVIALITVAVIVLNDVVNQQFSAGTIRSARYALGVLAGAAAVSAYHGAVFSADRALGLSGQAGPRSILLVGTPDRQLATELERLTGARVQQWTRLDIPTPQWQADTLAAAVQHSTGDLLVIAGQQDWQLIPVSPAGRPRPSAEPTPDAAAEPTPDAAADPTAEPPTEPPTG